MSHEPLSKSTPAPPTSDELLRKKSWKLLSGSLVVMQGTTQEFWKHEIPKWVLLFSAALCEVEADAVGGRREPKVKEGRISLTFRQLVF